MREHIKRFKTWCKYSKYSAGERRLMVMCEALNHKLETIMAAIDNLNTAVTAVETSAAAIIAAVQAIPASNDPAIQAAADKLTAVAANLAAAVPPPAQ